MKKSFYIFLIATVIVMGFIFFNSIQGADASNDSSDFVLELLAPVTDFIDKFIPNVDWQYVIRKSAHFTEFCVLGILSSITILCLNKHRIKVFKGYNFFYVLLVAVIDEFIQSFTGRTSSVHDVLLDFSGAFFGVFIVLIINCIRNKKIKKLSQK